ncbi:AbrB/MazE/SpoVT family DNA-binding domain-containing protein [Planomicrobium sp. Y74]|uniref:AbrB/MazE/SpoVT family DNA-binding domain-containing protein n=1 Tax=Planomicrobium sp. Y74 TaxID=2478977 RepID=UPI000EF540EF|nr:AbrB/MazE/SpoVT family DNA-binding domain-containing protein [Planomicrobium sp. Y74]RLQ84872.1 AbrB/MazE/SpoVT family DNA-binding domain-containing protein [Planomicrobium sp. Y74]
MKSTGMVRKVDQLGRIVTPIELRRSLGVSEGDPMEIFLEEDKIILKKYETDCTCAVTGEILDENVESTYVKGLYLSPKGAEILLKELQNKNQE